MDQSIKRRHPACPKCDRPMDWNSDQTVSTAAAGQVIEVYECLHCGRLKAFAPPHAGSGLEAAQIV